MIENLIVEGSVALGAAVAGTGLMASLKNKEDDAQTNEDWRLTYERGKLLKYLPYENFMEDTDIYINKDGSAGIAIECDPLPIVVSKIPEMLGSMLEIAPEGSVIQFHLVASSDIYPHLNAWKNKKIHPGQFEQEITEAYASFMDSNRYDAITQNFSAPVRDFKLIITIKMGGKEVKYKKFSSWFSSKQTTNSETSHFKDNYREIFATKDRAIGILRAGGLNARFMKADSLIRYIFGMLNQNKNIEDDLPKWDGSQIDNFMISNDNRVEIFDEHLKIGGVLGKSIAVKSYPEKWELSQILDYIGNPTRDDNLATPFIITLNTAKLKDFEKTKVKTGAGIVMSQQMSYSLFPRLRYKHEDLARGMDKLEKGEDLYYITIGVFLFGKDKEHLEKVSGRLRTIWRGNDFKVEEDRYIHFPSMITHLPFGFDMQIQEFLGKERGRVVFGENVADLAPVVADWKGNGDAMLFLSPRGQMVGFDLFANPTGGFNSFVVGMTGSGKSVFLQGLADNYHRQDDIVWIIDIGRSYERFTHAFGGQFIELKRDDPMCLNPFTTICDYEELEEQLDFLIDFFLLMGLPRERVLSEQLEKLVKSYLEEAINESYAKYGIDSCIDTVLEILDLAHGGDQRLIDFIKTMSPYKTAGQYGAFFNGRSTINFHSSIVTMENDTLENIPDLRDPALMLLTYHIGRAIYQSSKARPDQHHIVIIDEAHKFLGKSIHIDLFIEQAYRRFRKHGAAMILGTQGFEDFYGGDTISRAGRVIVQNSFWKFSMMQTSTSIEKILKSGYFNFSKAEEELFVGIAPVKGEYGEVMLLSESINTKLRVVLNDFLKTLLFTESDLREKIDKLVKEDGKTYLEAVESVSGKVNSWSANKNRRKEDRK